MSHYNPNRKNELYDILEGAAKYGVFSEPTQFVDAMFNFFYIDQIEEFVQHCKDDGLIEDDENDDEIEEEEEDDGSDCGVDCDDCGAKLDKDCDGNIRCPDCDGPCPCCAD